MCERVTWCLTWCCLCTGRTSSFQHVPALCLGQAAIIDHRNLVLECWWSEICRAGPPHPRQRVIHCAAAARGASAIASACSPGAVNAALRRARRTCRSHGRMRVKEWLDSCGALSTNMQRAEVDHVECRSQSDLVYNARGLKCATLARALSLSQRLHKSSSDMSRAAAAVGPHCSPSAQSASTNMQRAEIDRVEAGAPIFVAPTLAQRDSLPLCVNSYCKLK